MSDLNSVNVFGRLVRDATMKVSASGKKVVEFSIATNITYRNENGEFVQKGNFFPLAIYDTYAEKMLPYLKKGQKVVIEGYLKQNRWVTNEGKNRSATAIGVRQIHLIFDAKKNTENQVNADSAQNASVPENTASESESFDFSDEQLHGMYESEPESGDFFCDEDDFTSVQPTETGPIF